MPFIDEIVNTFIEKMEKTIASKVKNIEGNISDVVLGSPVPSRILQHIFLDKFRRSSNTSVAENDVTHQMVDALVRQIVRQKFEQRLPSGDIYDDYIRFLSGEQKSLMEISYTKQQQKQKQKQKAKSQDNDTMEPFDKRHRVKIVNKHDNYFDATVDRGTDSTKAALSLPLSVPIFTLEYCVGGKTNIINVYPTVQFLYSHHIVSRYISNDVQFLLANTSDTTQFCADFVSSVMRDLKNEESGGGVSVENTQIRVTEHCRFIRQGPQFSLVGIKPGVYVIGMKDQFNSIDRETHPLGGMLQYAMDEIGFILFDRTNSKSVDAFGPYFIENYLLLDVLSKQEVAQNVINYYCNHKDKLEKCLEQYDEKQGKGFICWRFLINQATMSATE